MHEPTHKKHALVSGRGMDDDVRLGLVNVGADLMLTEKPDTPQKHRRFLLFGGVEHEPAGGIHDLLSSHATIDEALQDTAHARGWWHVFDIDSGEVVAEMETYGLPE